MAFLNKFVIGPWKALIHRFDYGHLGIGLLICLYLISHPIAGPSSAFLLGAGFYWYQKHEHDVKFLNPEPKDKGYPEMKSVMVMFCLCYTPIAIYFIAAGKSLLF